MTEAQVTLRFEEGLAERTRIARELHDTLLQSFQALMNKRCRPYVRRANKSYRVDEACIKVGGKQKYLYRAVDSTGQTIDFLLTAKRDGAGAKRFFRKVFQ